MFFTVVILIYAFSKVKVAPLPELEAI